MQHCEGHTESGRGGLRAQQSLCFSVLTLCEVFVQFRGMDLQQTKIILPSLSLDFHTRHGILRRHCGYFETSFHTKVTLQSTTAVSHRGRGWPRQEHAWQKLWDGGIECRQMWNPGASNVGVSVKAACACVVYVTLRVFCVTLWGLIIIAPQIIKSYRLELKSKIWFEVMVKVWIWLSKRVGIKSNQCKNSKTTLPCYFCVSVGCRAYLWHISFDPKLRLWGQPTGLTAQIKKKWPTQSLNHFFRYFILSSALEKRAGLNCSY